MPFPPQPSTSLPGYTSISITTTTVVTATTHTHPRPSLRKVVRLAYRPFAAFPACMSERVKPLARLTFVVSLLMIFLTGITWVAVLSKYNVRKQVISRPLSMGLDFALVGEVEVHADNGGVGAAEVL
ncbi:hypothetical protein N0V88_006772 [Collariella sp. IMI 366227]|nr:hypothetical protein N0V88_006772 [Collariella sp. IMI 366227]